MYLSSKNNIAKIEYLLFQPSKPITQLKGDTFSFDFPNINFEENTINDIIEKEPIKPKEVNEQVNSELKEKSVKKMKKFKIETDETCRIKLPDDYSTDDPDEKEIVDLINGKVNIDWKEGLNSNGVTVYKNIVRLSSNESQKEDTGTIMLKTYGTLPYSLATILKAFNTIEIRRKWDKAFSSIDVLDKREEEDKTIEVLYLYMKMPFIMSDRDWIQQKKFWNNYGGKEKTALFHMKSVENKDYPEKTKPVRAKMFIGGYYMEEVNENETKIITLNHTDVKLPKMLFGTAQKKAPEGAKNFLVSLQKGCELALKQ